MNGERKADSGATAPCVWAVVLGYNHPEDSIECLHSLEAADWPGLRLLYVDNGSERSACDQVVAQTRCGVLRLEPNAGVAGGLNAGIRHAVAHGAEYIVILNNDTIVDRQAVSRLVRAGEANPRAGLIAPKIFYHAEPRLVWSAGSVFRRFPPVIVMRKTKVPDDGRYDRPADMAFATFCVIALRRGMVQAAGLLDPDYHFLYEDYDLCLRAAVAGFGVRYEPGAQVWHKISRTTGAGTPNPNFWRTYGRSEAIFSRKFRRHRWLTGRLHALYIVLRFLYEGNWYGLRPYIAGWRQGAADPLSPPPPLDDPRVARGALLREP